MRKLFLKLELHNKKIAINHFLVKLYSGNRSLLFVFMAQITNFAVYFAIIINAIKKRLKMLL